MQISPDQGFMPTAGTQATRVFSWSMLAVLLVFLFNNFLTNGFGLPPAGFAEDASLALALLYPIAFAAALWHVMRDKSPSLRLESQRMSAFNGYIIRAAFFAVLLVGLADMALSFLRVEGMLDTVFGKDLADSLGRPQFRGVNVHIPLILASIIWAWFSKTLGFHWLALLVVVAELLIVILRFVFSYEQSFMSDLVRFWYGALFLFASAYTLIEEGHVRVDVFYAGLKDRSKAVVNAVGTLFLGMSFCWVILIMGMGGKRSVINSPVFNFEVTQSGFGMYVKYLMAGFLGIFAVSMLIQFVSYFMAAVADYRGDPGKPEPKNQAAH